MQEEGLVMKGIKFGSGLVLLFVVMVFTGIACTNYTIPGKGTGEVKANSCEGCHTDYARLIAVHSPDTAPPVGGCGGEAPHYEPYDRVFMGGDGYDAYKSSGHYSVGCTGCHNGVGDTGERIWPIQVISSSIPHFSMKISADRVMRTLQIVSPQVFTMVRDRRERSPSGAD